ncbi:MAG: VWA domain-containing protein [Myxococcota bacterium]
MSLGLLAPFSLVLAGLAALPVIAHLARQTPRDRMAFGAMLLLERVVKRLRRRRRIKDWFLLLLRVLALVLLALAAAGPRLTYPGGVPEFGGTGRVVIVIDRSMSMSLTEAGSTLLSRARDEGVRVLDQLPGGTQVGVVVFDEHAMALTSELTDDLDRARSLVRGIQPTHGVSDLKGGLHEARRLLGGEPGEVIVVSDEAGPVAVREARPELEALVELGSTVLPLTVKGEPPRNVAVTEASYGSGEEGGSLTLKLANYGPQSIEVACEVTLPDGQQIPIFADLPPEGEAAERLTIPQEALGGVGAAVCQDPDLPADDARYFHLPRVGASRVLVVDGDPGDTPTRSEVYFLERALAPWGGVKSGVAIDVTAPSGLASLDPEKHRVVFMANVADPRPFGPLLTEFVRKGGNLVITAGDNITAERYNAALGAILPAPFRKPRSLADREEQGVPLLLPTTDHPLFAAFSRSGRSAFASVRSHRILTLEAYKDRPDEVTTLLQYEGGAPALVERRIGAGRVLVWTSTVDWSWSNFPLQAAFMPSMQRLVHYLGGESGNGAARFEGIVGEPVRIPLPDLNVDPDVVGPDGSVVRSRMEGSQVVFTPERAGAYRLEIEDAAPLAWIAVNTNPVESDVRPYDTLAAVERELNPELFVRHADLSGGLLGFAFGALVLQALLALRRSS